MEGHQIELHVLNFIQVVRELAIRLRMAVSDARIFEPEKLRERPLYCKLEPVADAEPLSNRYVLAMTGVSNERPGSIIRWHYLWYVAAALAMMVAAIAIQNLWLLNYVHVFSSLLWTGIDLYIGFVLGPILRRTDISVRREVMRRLTPRTLFLM